MSARIFVISDTHHGHGNIYKFLRADGVTRVRPEFDSAEEADREMVKRWNSVVMPQDHVWHLGDVTMERGKNRAFWFVSLIRSLNGHKRLVLGNHDQLDMKLYTEAGFQKIRGSHRIDRKWLLSHIPLHHMSIPEGCVNVHGHIHERAAFGPQYRNVSVEQIAYTPVLLDTL